MEKRALLAFVLSLLVLIGYQYLFPPQKMIHEEVQQVETTKESKPEEKKASSRPETVVKDLEEQKKDSQKIRVSPLEGQTTRPEEIVHVETRLADYRISTKNAVIKEITLKKYRDEDGQPIHIIREGEKKLYPLEIFFDGEMLNADFTPSRRDIRLESGEGDGTLTMTYLAPKGGWLKKKFTFHPDDYQVEVEITQNLPREYQLVVGSLFLKKGEKSKSTRYNHVGPVLNVGGEIERVKLKKVQEEKVFQGEIPWAAFETKYFLTALLPEQQTKKAVVDRVKRKDGTEFIFGVMNSKESVSYHFYAGPKDYEILKSYHNDLVRVINFGFFGFLAKPLFFVLKAIYKIVRNYGVAIILLTTIIKVIFTPLTYKQQKSMQEMQKIQPQISAIREKYKKDPQTMNREIMALYKKYKVNPAAGCLPLIIQIPVFFALYNVLLSAIELRQAPFLYIHDLSAADTLFGHIGGFAVGPLPLLMGVTMFLQQKMTPTAMDPKQAKLFQYMPVIFTFMFLNFPSGLVLYWLVNNVLTIAQQMYINKQKTTVRA